MQKATPEPSTTNTCPLATTGAVKIASVNAAAPAKPSGRLMLRSAALPECRASNLYCTQSSARQTPRLPTISTQAASTVMVLEHGFIDVALSIRPNDKDRHPESRDIWTLWYRDRRQDTSHRGSRLNSRGSNPCGCPLRLYGAGSQAGRRQLDARAAIKDIRQIEGNPDGDCDTRPGYCPLGSASGAASRYAKTMASFRFPAFGKVNVRFCSNRA